MVALPVEHLSASSITTFLRCPRQWQDKYVLGNRGVSNSSLVIGSATHAMMAGLLKGEVPDVQTVWDTTVAEAGEVVWKDPADRAFNIYKKHVWDYYETVGKHLNVTDTEVEILVDVPGVPIPVLGYVDILCADRVVDVKTTAYMSAAKVQVNREWILQANIYQMAHELPAEFHVVTRAKDNPLVLPTSPSHPLYVAPRSPFSTKNFVAQVYKEIEMMVSEYGSDVPWRGNVTHPWADKYCAVENCCRKEA